jgi:hypothetical protein
MYETVAIMQPYFFPYLGYFRLFSQSDAFVLLDSVQFPRRGWVHRNRFTDATGTLQWLTLPIAKGAQPTTMISDLRFQTHATTLLSEQIRRFPCLKKLADFDHDLAALVLNTEVPVTEYLANTLGWVCERLGVSRPMIRASELTIDGDLKGQERIIAIAKALGARRYLNAPGGADLYDLAAFQAANLGLHFLPAFVGGYQSVLERLLTSSTESLRRELMQS